MTASENTSNETDEKAAAADKPAESEAATQEAAESKSSPAVTASVNGTSAQDKSAPAVTHRILVVEDSLPLRRMLCKILETNNCKPDEAENGKLALERLEEMGVEKYSAILSDIMMPVMDGPTFIETARERYGEKLPPVLVCSSRSDREAVQIVMRLGVSGYILKPFKTGTVIEKLRKILDA